MTQYMVMVDGATALLDYVATRDMREHNQRADMILGKLTLRFTSTTFDELDAIVWTHEGGTVDDEVPLEITRKDFQKYCGTKLGNLELVTVKRGKRDPKFRYEVSLAYGGTCCIS